MSGEVTPRGTEALPDADRLREIALLWWGDKQAEPARAELRAWADALDSGAGVRQHRDTPPTREEDALTELGKVHGLGVDVFATSAHTVVSVYQGPYSEEDEPSVHHMFSGSPLSALFDEAIAWAREQKIQPRFDATGLAVSDGVDPHDAEA